jgi:drug/metabolite transporter (DMT)-like permease
MGSLLLLSSAFLHAFWNALAKKDRDIQVNLMGIILISALCGTLSLPLFKGPQFYNMESLWWGIAAGICEAGYMITLVFALKETTLGLAYTIMRGGAMLLVWMISLKFLNEQITFLTVIGIVLVFSGLFVSNITLKKRIDLSQAKWSYACAAFIAGYHLCYGRSLNIGASPGALFALSLFIAVPIFFLISGRGSIKALIKKMKHKPSYMVLGGILSAASFLIFLVGLRLSGAGFAITLRNTSIVFAQIFSLMLGEKLSRQQLIGAGMVCVGAGFLSWNG